MRLAFSVAINVDADILLIDEILAVGDAHFQEKCFEKMQEIKKSGTTIVIVSHSLGQIEEICDRSIWIDAGRIRMDGQPKEVHEKYLEYMGVKTAEQKREKIHEEQEKEREKQAKQEQKAQQLAASTFRLQDICYTDEKGESTHLYQPGKTGSLTLAYSVDQVCEHAELAFSIGADEWVAVKGTDLKAIPVGTFATEVKQSRLLTYLSDIARDDENLVKQMKYNGACEWMEDRLVIHNGGVMYGPYLTMPPMQYKLCVEVNYEGSATPVFTVTKESGNVRLGEMQLKNGFNAMNLYLGEKAENLEFVLSNVTEEDIVVKKITFI